MLQIPVRELFKQIQFVEIISKKQEKSVTMEIHSQEMDVVLLVKKKVEVLEDDEVVEVDDEDKETTTTTMMMNQKRSIPAHLLSRDSKEQYTTLHWSNSALVSFRLYSISWLEMPKNMHQQKIQISNLINLLQQKQFQTIFLL